jgi:hypothetical protein
MNAMDTDVDRIKMVFRIYQSAQCADGLSVTKMDQADRAYTRDVRVRGFDV